VITRIHVNQHKLRAGDPQPLTVKDYRDNRPASRADIIVNGEVVASIIVDYDHPLPCGAKAWVQTDAEVVVR
jgi:hypothetical protein